MHCPAVRGLRHEFRAETGDGRGRLPHQVWYVALGLGARPWARPVLPGLARVDTGTRGRASVPAGGDGPGGRQEVRGELRAPSVSCRQGVPQLLRVAGEEDL